jgi:plasmid stabilization system protein ParE
LGIRSSDDVKEATMPKEWSEKRERQYEHIKEGYEDEGVSTKEAKRRAAATVNESRRKSGETKKKRS